jgi:hypothetical protein
METENFTDTSGRLSRNAEVTQAYVGQLSRAGLIPFITASDGTRLYRPDAAETVRRIKRERLANRGRKRDAA